MPSKKSAPRLLENPSSGDRSSTDVKKAARPQAGVEATSNGRDALTEGITGELDRLSDALGALSAELDQELELDEASGQATPEGAWDGRDRRALNHDPAMVPPGGDRRLGTDRRSLKAKIGPGGLDTPTGLERRRGPGRRRTEFARSAEEGEMTTEQFLFVMAIEAFKRSNGKMYPTWTDVLEVVRLLGYRKTLASELAIQNAEDWTEASDALSGVRAKPGHPEKRVA